MTAANAAAFGINLDIDGCDGFSPPATVVTVLSSSAQLCSRSCSKRTAPRMSWRLQHSLRPRAVPRMPHIVRNSWPLRVGRATIIDGKDLLSVNITL